MPGSFGAPVDVASFDPGSRDGLLFFDKSFVNRLFIAGDGRICLTDNETWAISRKKEEPCTLFYVDATKRISPDSFDAPNVCLSTRKASSNQHTGNHGVERMRIDISVCQ